MDAHALSEAMGGTLSLARYRELLPAYEKMLHIVGARTVNQCAMIAAQLGHESVGLKYQSEIWGPTTAQRTYDGRMGNRPGTSDWSDFRGHGWIQVTGRNNHTACSRWAHDRGIVPTPDYFVTNPAALGSDEYCWVGPAWYLTAARPGFMDAADRGELENCTRQINGGLNGLSDRRARYDRALAMGSRLLPGEAPDVVEKVLDYSRDQIDQDTGYNCGPASVQTVVKAATGKFFTEAVLGSQLGTHRGGTDWIGQFPTVLNRHVPGADYEHVEMPNDPPTVGQKNRLWDDVVNSINAGFGVVANIVAPVNNYPRAVPPSTIHPAYAGGMVYHYVAIMGYSTDGQKKYWIADSGFAPFGYWISHSQMASLIPPKGYAYASVPAPATTSENAPEPTFMEELMSSMVPSFVNPDKEFPAPVSLGLIDRQGWEDGVLSRALFYALGLDPHKVLTAAVEADNAGGDVDAAIRGALGIRDSKGEQ